ncbi:Ribulose-phosphate 3-epimerase [Cronobacter malonaticus 507]|nr:Ribulose-phosphate 3-epimerase [Cronobacter malonaticus 507]
MDKLQKIRAVAFDLDGTLVDSAPGLTWAVDNALYALELPRGHRIAAAAGADMFVAGSAIFNEPDYQKVINDMRSELAKVSHG